MNKNLKHYLFYGDFHTTTERKYEMRFIGYMLVATASVILSLNGFGINTWQWWAISMCFITGEFIICKECK
jgi:hypothetical protein